MAHDQDNKAKEGELVEEDEEAQILVCPEHAYDPTIISQSRADQVMTDDVRSVNHSLSQLGRAWKAATCIDDVCKLSMTTIKLLEMRRRLMLFSLEPDEGKSRKKSYVEAPPRETKALDDEREEDPRYT